ncbi:MAG: 30S ribosomal protein S4 [Spirochaetia bacterium]|nr:30S ribosomal protein S4 [Spirochaetia bacterium]
MARYTGPVCRLCRREKMKLFLKGERCFSAKCAIEKKKGPPGVAIQKRKNMSEFGVQLREKQKVKRHYGLMERQFRLYFEKSAKISGETGTNLLVMLEKRLDNVIYRLGFASSRRAARQLVRHAHVQVNGKKVNIPSFQVRLNDQIALVPSLKENAHVVAAGQVKSQMSTKPWLDINPETKVGTVLKSPVREDVDIEIEENLIVELYNK